MNYKSRDFEVGVFSTIRGQEKNWDGFTAPAPHLKSIYLSALERSRPRDVSFRYLLVRKNKAIVAVAYMQMVNFTGQNFSGNNSSLALLPLKLFFRLKKVHILFCGNLFRVNFKGYHFNENEITFKELVDIVQHIRSEEKCQLLMMKEVNGSDEKEALLSQDFRKYEEDMTMALTLRESWNSLDEYCASLTKKYSKRLYVIRHKRKGVVVRRLPPEELVARLPEIGRLFNETAGRQFLKMGIIDENYFTEMQRPFIDCFYVNGYFLEGKMIAFASHLIHREMLEVHYIGIDYAYNDRYALYFNILFDGVEQAIEQKRKMLELGRTARNAKASVGCIPVASNDYIFVKTFFVKKLIHLFEKLFLKRMGDTWKQRNPIREQVTSVSETA